MEGSRAAIIPDNVYKIPGQCLIQSLNKDDGDQKQFQRNVQQ